MSAGHQAEAAINNPEENPNFHQTIKKYAIVREIHELIKDRIIRRSINSKNYAGESISTLMPKHVINYFVRLSEREYANMESIVNKLVETTGRSLMNAQFEVCTLFVLFVSFFVLFIFNVRSRTF